MEDSPKFKMPYLSFKTFKSFLEGLAHNETGLPGKIDRSLLATQSGSVQSSVMNALVFFSLIDLDGRPSAKLRAFVAGDDEVRRGLWSEMWSEAYSEIYQKVEVVNCTEGQFTEAVRSLSGYSGETVRKAIAFYIALSSEAKCEISTYLKPPKRAPRRPKKRSTPNIQTKVKTDSGASTDDSSAWSKLQLSTGSNPRCLEVRGPIQVTKAELDRIQQWLGFHFIIVDSVPDTPKLYFDEGEREDAGM